MNEFVFLFIVAVHLIGIAIGVFWLRRANKYLREYHAETEILNKKKGAKV